MGEAEPGGLLRSARERWVLLLAGARPDGGMLQRLLAERFGMKFHRESQELPVYLFARPEADKISGNR